MLSKNFSAITANKEIIYFTIEPKNDENEKKESYLAAECSGLG